MQVCVVGIPDKICTSFLAAAVIKKVGSSVTEDEILEYSNQILKDLHKLRGGVYFFDTFPRTSNGKLKRNAILEDVIKMYEANKKQ